MTDAAPEVVVAEGVWGEALATLAATRRVLRTDDLAGPLGGAGALVVRNRTQVDRALLDSAPRLRVVGRAGVGLDNIDLAACDERGVVVVAGLGANAVSVGELTVGLALSVLRAIPAHDRAVRAGRWERTPGRELSGSVWGLLGAGATALATARLLRGFDVRVLAFDPYADPAAVDVELADLSTVVAGADVLSVHLPATEQTRGMVGADLLAGMKPSAVLVSVGRGEVVDEVALAAALRDGRLAGAGLDVRSVEPPAPGPLDDLPNVVLTPHVAGITAQSQERIVAILAADIAAVLDGRPAARAVGRVRQAGG